MKNYIIKKLILNRINLIINTISLELEKICEIVNNLELKEKLIKIPKLTLKFVATNQSLYI